MARNLSVLVIVLTMIVPGIVGAQGASWGLPQGGPPPALGPALPYGNMFAPPSGTPETVGRTLYPDELWTVRSRVKGGHQQMRLSINFPVPSADIADPNAFFLEDLDLSLGDGRFWVGFFGLEVQPIQDLILFGEVGGNIVRDSEILMDTVGAATRPLGSGLQGSGANLVSPWTWRAQDFQWWIFDFGIAYKLSSAFALEAGFRWEQKEFTMLDPRNNTEAVNGVPPGVGITCPRI